MEPGYTRVPAGMEQSDIPSIRPKRKKARVTTSPSYDSVTNYMESIIAWPNSEHDSKVAPSIWRSKS
jgi:hypothetical protein